MIKEYDQLKNEYELLRRPFSVSSQVPYTDVWTFKPVPYYTGKHPCEKPSEMLKHIIQTSSRPGQIVLDLFMGSGSTGKVCAQLGRSFIGVELEGKRYEQTVSEFNLLIEKQGS
mgnify:CR=1 FL=1